ncbi:PLP-dependent aminotransferase family protein [Chitinophagaceae bacterium LB-8]|uniref:PLP-dependent aminotransferase family protein n=1 Tax=Paraflavisolibacter caeni TaxID=2982496 RepID=A0A9X2Y0S7_9BACT|nr:PLP-dependent aminotransferase family protein [Paraflavisolibacter caeni]MCU7552885.1 PLP-dependent aminotransferase family protein [Paraflavisolibacter caeni]
MEAQVLPLEEEFLYVQLAEKLQKNILDGVLKTGEKLLSVRALSKEQGVSLSTAFNAYTQLEIKGLIEARPKSGYYVSFRKRVARPTSETEDQDKIPEEASVDDIISLVYRDINAEGLIRLSIAVPAIELLPVAKLSKTMAEAIRESVDSCMGYEHPQGNLRLRKQIARYAFNWGGNITEKDVVTTQGCMEALVFCLKAVAEPGDTIAIETPTYFGIFSVMKSLGLKVLEIPTHPEEGISLEYLADAIEKVTIKACLFVTNFTNPLGCEMSDEKKKRLVELLAAKEIPLIEDDIYGELYFGKKRPRTCKSFDQKGLVLLCASVSKSLAPGYRVGWCIPGKFIDKVKQIKLMHIVSSATPNQAAVGLFFETGRFDLHLRNLRKALYTQSLLYTKAIVDYFPESTKVSQPKGGCVLWVELDKRIDAFELFKSGLKYNISISPGHIFSTDARFTNCIRICYGAPLNKEIEHALKILGRLAKDMIKI